MVGASPPLPCIHRPGRRLQSPVYMEGSRFPRVGSSGLAFGDTFRDTLGWLGRDFLVFIGQYVLCLVPVSAPETSFQQSMTVYGTTHKARPVRALLFWRWRPLSTGSVRASLPCDPGDAQIAGQARSYRVGALTCAAWPKSSMSAFAIPLK